MAYAAAARRGDVLPVCLRLASLRREAAWTARLELVQHVGPACKPETLDRAVELMPEAPEPRLLRAGRSLAAASVAPSASTRDAWLAYAHRDVVEAARLDPMDATARVMLADLVGSSAWAVAARAA
ncbi:MAG: hypothetical protein KF819_30845 [Labilithrix sp.]|nr:hypothetical protein [Labilithrix sp.]